MDEIDYQDGYIAFYIIGMVVMFILLFCVFHYLYLPNFTELLRMRKINLDISGATLLAIARSSPELFIMILCNSLCPTDIGNHTILGSTIFNTVFASAAFINLPRHCSACTHVRNLIFYLVATALLLLISMYIYSTAQLWKPLVLLLLYNFYLRFTILEVHLFKCARNAEQEDATTAELQPMNQTNTESAVEPRNLGSEQPKESWLTNQKRYFIIPLTIISAGVMFLICYFLVWWGSVVAETFRFKYLIIGLLPLALPITLITCFSILLRTSRPLAVHTSMSSNIFLNTVGLAVPWLIFAPFSDYGIFLDNAFRWSLILIPIPYILVSISILCGRKGVSYVMCILTFMFALIIIILVILFSYRIIFFSF